MIIESLSEAIEANDILEAAREDLKVLGPSTITQSFVIVKKNGYSFPKNRSIGNPEEYDSLGNRIRARAEFEPEDYEKKSSQNDVLDENEATYASVHE